MTTAEEEKSPYPEPLEDEPEWMRGFDVAMEMAVEIGLDARPMGWEEDVQAATALQTAVGHCVLCGTGEDVHEIKPRHPSRQSIWLCRADLEKVLERSSATFPGEPPPDETPPMDLGDEMFMAGFRAGLLHSVTVLDSRPMPDAPDDPLERARNRRSHYYANLCSLCPRYAWRYRTSSGQHGQLGLCSGCLDHLHDLNKLLGWSGSTVVGAKGGIRP